MRFAIVTLCLLFISVSAKAEKGVEPYEYFGFHLGDSWGRVHTVLWERENELKTSQPVTIVDGSEVHVSLEYGGDLSPAHLYFTDKKLSLIFISGGIRPELFDSFCTSAEKCFGRKPNVFKPDNIAIFKLKGGVKFIVYKRYYIHLS